MEKHRAGRPAGRCAASASLSSGGAPSFCSRGGLEGSPASTSIVAPRASIRALSRAGAPRRARCAVPCPCPCRTILRAMDTLQSTDCAAPPDFTAPLPTRPRAVGRIGLGGGRRAARDIPPSFDLFAGSGSGSGSGMCMCVRTDAVGRLRVH
ncbi:hypothetical protein HETIRDRAFT_439989 [Heterobasidion irregulare TC 32-1]|uniref:Uncharacterized protein n=1 Tax=Heterobasidion irregulare (strain TC 32-1) TaxID=747525 RepID=W4K8G3_HETIT|nr:uncharacterized protein HETIRDRAFT_439989 [Heterobasidion irregulare TC 32-1]ETW81640.1 hypothetical protein HETIRDRAFT_439989 [Heterobasidion irregulare TC 32-1]